MEAVDTPPGGAPADLQNGRRTMVLRGNDVSAMEGRDRHAQRPDLADVGVRAPATSTDGLDWTRRRTALGPTPQSWDARGTRITSAFESDGKWIASCDGRASAAENCFERTGFAMGAVPDDFVAVAGPVSAAGRTLRYLSIAELPDGLRLYVETARDDGANELRTTFLAA